MKNFLTNPINTKLSNNLQIKFKWLSDFASNMMYVNYISHPNPYDIYRSLVQEMDLFFWDLLSLEDENDYMLKFDYNIIIEIIDHREYFSTL